MSQFVISGSCIKDEGCLVKALMRVGGWTEDQIEISKEATNLFGYQGDRRNDLANVIVRRTHIGRYSNDIGFHKNEKGTYDVIISEYDKCRFNDAWVTRLTNLYNEERVIRECQMLGYSYKVEESTDGVRKLVAYVTS